MSDEDASSESKLSYRSIDGELYCVLRDLFVVGGEEPEKETQDGHETRLFSRFFCRDSHLSLRKRTVRRKKGCVRIQIIGGEELVLHKNSL